MDTFVKLIQALAPVVTVGLAVFGLFVWHWQLVGKRKFEIAEQAVTVWRRANDGLSHVRDPFVRGSEGELVKIDEKITGKKRENAERHRYIYERLNNITDAFKDVRVTQILVDLHIDHQTARAFDILFRVRHLIRVDADEVTYPAHVILRYEIERALIEGQIECEDIPALWDAKMMELLGIDTSGNFRDGCMQDVHWGAGLFGYFPCYTLGAMYAAQWFASMRRENPGLDGQIAAANLQPVFAWLHSRIWSQGSRWETPELVRRASGETLNPAHFKAHLQARYLG